MRKIVLDLLENLCSILDEKSSLILIGKYLVIKKLDFEDGTTLFNNMISSSEAYDLGNTHFKEINLQYNILTYDENNSIFNFELIKIVNEKLLPEINQISFDKLVEFYDLLIKESKSIATKFLPASIEKLAMKIFNNQEDKSIYLGAVGMGLCKEKFMQLKVQNDIIYRCDMDKSNVDIWRLREFLKYSKSFTRFANPILEPIMENGRVKQFDLVLMNPPFGLTWKNIENEIVIDKYGQFTYGLANARSAELLFASHTLNALKEDGKGVIVVPSGSLFCTGKDQRVREKMLENDVIEAVVALPEGLYKNSGISVNLIIFNKNKQENMKEKILFINAESMGVQNRKNCILDDTEIQKIVDIYCNKINQDELSRIININEIKEANLLPSRYVYKRTISVEGVGVVSFDWTTFPDGKEYASLDKFVDVYRGINITKEIQEDETGEYKIINLADVQNGQLVMDKLKSYTITNNAKVSLYEVQENDIIITARGELTKICRIPYIKGKILLSQNFYGMRLKNDYFHSKIIKMYLESPVGQYMLSKKKSGTAIPLLSTKDLKSILLPDIEDRKQREAIFFMEGKLRSLEEERKRLAREEKQMKLDAWRKMGIQDFFKIE
ncbi:type I restriction-modification system subunit M/S [Anaerosinus gibii]|uniref:site-specific DNA-methyltransferase (adenine-specific) n=1 Tax=Selenobaculum gibii TaxID=3054208 RepID=A0A9Y2AGY5_9FIRM|nr:type I restriction-modification system subunit M/S [Selenobaculum gbiensis]WIW69884.1 N-6 DNA methylase [Selenobaculum gbiensis]